MIYLDNAATSYPKPEKVYLEIDRCFREYCANPGRGGHAMSIESGKAVIKTREALGMLFGIRDPLRICLMKNATEAINVALRGFLKPGDHVITTSMEHNSVIRPLKTMQRDMGLELTILQANPLGEIDPGEINKELKPNTRLLVCTLSSNVNGTMMPVKDIGGICRDKGIVLLLDASQGAGTVPLDVEELHVGMLAFPGHKGLLGPQGTGGLFVAEGIELTPLTQGGTGSNSENIFQPAFMPDALESGTLNTPGIVGLACGVEFILSIGIDNISIFKGVLNARLHEGLREIPGVQLYSLQEMEKNSGIAAFNVMGIDSTEVSYILDKEFGIATRAGLHCAPLAHQTLGTESMGIIRMSVGCFNTVDEIDSAVSAVRKIYERYKV